MRLSEIYLVLKMKILAISSYIDLKPGMGCIPQFWQLLKSLYEIGCDITVIPYAERDVETLWWKAYPNPCYYQSKAYETLLKLKRKKEVASKSNKKINKYNGINPIRIAAKFLVEPIWKRTLYKLIKDHKGFDLILFLNIPLNHVPNLVNYLRKIINTKIVYYDGDMPVHLPEYGGFSTGGYFLTGNVLSEFDLVISNSGGVEQDLKKFGAQKVSTLHWAVDPSVYTPLENQKKKYDVFFYGYGSEFRENAMQNLLTDPSIKLHNKTFIIGGKRFNRKFGRTKYIGTVPFAKWRVYASQTRINLNITRESHALTAQTSTARPFELAAMKSCIISNYHEGIYHWFDIGKEIFVANTTNEAIELYNWLLDDDNLREEIIERAYNRVLKEHTYINRAKQLLTEVKQLK